MMDPATARAVEAAAKPVDRALAIIQDTGSYLKEVVGDLPKNAVGALGGDWLAHKRIRNLDALRRRTEEIIRERDATPVDQLSPNVAGELLSGAQEESREELIELWARLLANAIDPKMNSIRHSFIDAVKRMDPPDAVVLNFLREKDCRRINIGSGIVSESGLWGTFDISARLARTQDSVVVSVEHLTTLGLLVSDGGHGWFFSATGKEFLRACYP